MTEVIAAVTTMTLTEFHDHMAHAHPEALVKMINDEVITGIKLKGSHTLDFCNVCVQAKHAVNNIPRACTGKQATEYGEIVHTDIWGPATTETPYGEKYYLTYINEATDKGVLILLKRKSEQHAKYLVYETWVKVHRNPKGIRTIMSDRGGEYTSKAFKAHLESEGTTQRLTVHDSPWQNGRAERINRSAGNGGRALLFASNLPKSLWGYVMKHWMWLRNRTTTINTPNSTPYERATHKKPNLSNLRRFGEEVWVKLDPKSKLNERSTACQWIGYDETSKGHLVWWGHKVSVERNVIFSK